MAKPITTEEKVISFYCFNKDNVLRTETDVDFYSPFANKKFNPIDPNNPLFDGEEKYTFKKGILETSDPNAIEFFTYLATGLSPVTGTDVLSNGKRIKIDVVNRIRMDKPKPKTETKTITETVEVQVIPKSMVDSFTVEILTDFCRTWNVNLPDFTDGNVKEKIIATLEATGHIK